MRGAMWHNPPPCISARCHVCCVVPHGVLLLQLIPVELVLAYKRAMLNIHPGLLPSFGGKGLYGERVHAAVVKSGARCAGSEGRGPGSQREQGPIHGRETPCSTICGLPGACICTNSCSLYSLGWVAYPAHPKFEDGVELYHIPYRREPVGGPPV